jgi:periplasmic protein TonB
MRRSFTLCSVVVHTLVISAALIAQVLAVGPLPTPHLPLMFDASHIMLVDIQLPAPPRRAARATGTNPDVPADAAPTIAPDGVIDETGREGLPARPPGLIAGVESGPPAAVDGLRIGSVALPPPPQPAVPVRLHSGMKAPQRIVNVAPAYPAIARSAHVQGVVILEAVIDATGGVESVRVLRALPLLDQAAVDAVRQWRFTPAVLNNEAVPVVMTVTVNFTLQER